MEGWCLRNGRTSKASSCCGETRFASTMLFGEPGICNVSPTTKHTDYSEGMKWWSPSATPCFCRCREETEPRVPFRHSFGWKYGLRSTPANRGVALIQILFCFFSSGGLHACIPIVFCFPWRTCSFHFSCQITSQVPCFSVNQAIATEGKYWKRRIEIVIREYHKWRTYFKKRVSLFCSLH